MLLPAVLYRREVFFIWLLGRELLQTQQLTMKVFTSPFADWPWISRLCGQPMACLWTYMSSGCLCMLFLWSGTLRGSTVFLVVWSLDVSYCRKYVTKHHFGLRWIFHFCFIVHSLELQLAGIGLPGLKDTLFFLLGDLLILNERFYHVFFWQSVLSWPMQIQWLWLSWRIVMPNSKYFLVVLFSSRYNFVHVV